MSPGNYILIIIDALVVLVHSLPLNIGQDPLQYDPNSVIQNEDVLKLFLQLATHAANRLTSLRKKTNVNKNYVNTEMFITQQPFQASLEQNSDKIQYRIFSGNFDRNNDTRLVTKDLKQHETFWYPTQSEELLISNDLHKIDNQDAVHNGKLNASDLISQVKTNIQNVSDSKHDYKLFDSVTSPKTVLDFNSSLDESNLLMQDFENSTINDVSERLFNSNTFNPQKYVSIVSVMDDLMKTVNECLPNSQNSQYPTLEENKQLHYDPTKSVFDMRSNSHVNITRDILWQENLQKSPNSANDMNQRFFTPTSIKAQENIASPQIIDKIYFGNQILLNAKSIVNVIIKGLSKTLQSANNILNQFISRFQNIINVPSELMRDEKYINFDNTLTNISDSELINQLSAQANQSVSGLHQYVKASENVDSFANQFSNYIPHQIGSIKPANKSENIETDYHANHQSSTNSLEYDINDTTERDKENININNLTKTISKENNKQFMSASSVNLESLSLPGFRLFWDFDEHRDINEEKKINLTSAEDK